MRVPEYLQASTDAGGQDRVDWLAALPAHVAGAAEKWALDFGDPFEPGGNCSWVAPATDSDGRLVVVKMAWRHAESRDEAEGLAMLGGQDAVDVYAYEHVAPDTTAMLLERCTPGAELRGRPEAEQHVVVTELLRSAWAVSLPTGHPFRPLSEMADDWIARAQTAAPALLDAGMVREGLALFRELSRPRASDVLLLTDLHAGNVLAATRRPWLIIDPKPYVGDPHYDVLQHLLNCNESLQADALGVVKEVADLACLDADRVTRWLFARCVQDTLREGPAFARLDVIIRQLGTAL